MMYASASFKLQYMSIFILNVYFIGQNGQVIGAWHVLGYKSGPVKSGKNNKLPQPSLQPKTTQPGHHHSTTVW